MSVSSFALEGKYFDLPTVDGFCEIENTEEYFSSGYLQAVKADKQVNETYISGYGVEARTYEYFSKFISAQDIFDSEILENMVLEVEKESDVEIEKCHFEKNQNDVSKYKYAAIFTEADISTPEEQRMWHLVTAYIPANDYVVVVHVSGIDSMENVEKIFEEILSTINVHDYNPELLKDVKINGAIDETPIEDNENNVLDKEDKDDKKDRDDEDEKATSSESFPVFPIVIGAVAIVLIIAVAVVAIVAIKSKSKKQELQVPAPQQFNPNNYAMPQQNFGETTQTINPYTYNRDYRNPDQQQSENQTYPPYYNPNHQNNNNNQQ